MSGRKDRERRKEERIAAETKEQDEGRRKRLLQLASAGVFLAIVAVAVLIVVNSSGDGGGDASNLEGVAEVESTLQGIPQNGMVLGDPKAPVKVVEFGDLKCPHCAAFADESIPALAESIVGDGEASIEFRNFTIIDEQSETAGAAALAAGEQNRGWSFLEIFYRNQGEESQPYADGDFLTAVAKAAKVPDIEQWNADRQSRKVLRRVRQTTNEAVGIGFEGTPSFAFEEEDGELEPLGPVDSAAGIEAEIEAAG